MSQIGMSSILVSIKKLLGITEDYTPFDGDIIIHINSVFSVLTQLGIGPATGFVIQDATTLWGDFLSNELRLEAVKSYVYMKVRILFDPPTSTAALESLQKMIGEAEWRLAVQADEISRSRTAT